jgi:hypothetical protein
MMGFQVLSVRDLVSPFVLSALVVLAWTISFLTFIASRMYLYLDEPVGLVVLATPVIFALTSSREHSSRDFKPSSSTLLSSFDPLASHSPRPSRAIVTNSGS